MTDTCIVCLGDLRVAEEEAETPVKRECEDDASADAARAPAIAARATAPPEANTSPSGLEDDETIAHLLPCGHNLHDSCLRPWVERANSCPICRVNFNEVELKRYVDAPAYSSYGVQDKRQQAEVDASLVIDDELFDDAPEACVICGSIDGQHEQMYCDGCDAAVHVFCAGFDDAHIPEVWYCDTCNRQLEGSGRAPRRRRPFAGIGYSTRPASSSARRARRRPRPADEWDRVWQSVWRNLNIDLDFPFDDHPHTNLRTPAQRDEFEQWQRRLDAGRRQPGSNRFGETANMLLNRQQRQTPPPPESQEVLRAWNAFDKARHLEDSPVVQSNTQSNNRRKRKSITASPASPRDGDGDNDPAPERKLKRPRTRRNITTVEAGPSAGPSSGPANPSTSRPLPQDGPSFLTSLLQEVERQPVHDVGSLDYDDVYAMSGDEQQDGSPLTSGQVSPRASSVTPPPLQLTRPSSPMTPTRAALRRPNSPTSYSPFSPASAAAIVANTGANDGEARRRHLTRGRAPAQQAQSSPLRQARNGQSPASPSRNISYSTKQEIQRMVKAALRPRYLEKEISKDQYTDINRDVSRMLYDKIGDAEGLAQQGEREKWQTVAMDEVAKAVHALTNDVNGGAATNGAVHDNGVPDLADKGKGKATEMVEDDTSPDQQG